MEKEQQLAWEARAGRRVALAAFAGAVLSFTSGIYLQVALGDRPDGADEYLKAANDQPGDFIVTGVLQALAVLLMIPVLLYLYRAVRFRRSQLQPAARILAVLGAVTLASVTLIRYFQVVDAGKDFFPFDVPNDSAGIASKDDYAEAVDPEKAAEKAVREALSPALQGIGLGGSVALAFAMIMISLNAMRAGLLSRFLGILGIFIGALYVIPLGVQIVQLFWLFALGLLLLNKWPGGRGPAWQTGHEAPWPTAAQRRTGPEPVDEGPPKPRSKKRRKPR